MKSQEIVMKVQIAEDQVIVPNINIVLLDVIVAELAYVQISQMVYHHVPMVYKEIVMKQLIKEEMEFVP